jgi:hypothetical protein
MDDGFFGGELAGMTHNVAKYEKKRIFGAVGEYNR